MNAVRPEDTGLVVADDAFEVEVPPAPISETRLGRSTRRQRMLRAFVVRQKELREHVLRHPEVVKATIQSGESTPWVVDPPLNRAVLWGQIARGELLLLEQKTTTAHGLKRYLVADNEREGSPKRRLSAGELDVIEHSIAGLSTKAIAHALGISSSIVSQRLGTAAIKVGAASRTELVRLAAALIQTEPVAAYCSYARLTEAEREVLALLREGMTNEQIAVVRERSVRTIANQVAALLRKTRAPTRRSLAIQSLK